MNIKTTFFLISIILIIVSCSNETGNLNKKENNSKEIVKEDNIPLNAKKLIKAYPDYIIGYENNYIIWKDSSRMLYDDKKSKNFDELLNKPDIQDMFTYKYVKNNLDIPKFNDDPGRIRFEPLFFKMYGNNKTEVSKNLVAVYWLPSSINKKIYVTKINNVNQKIQAISNELDKLPHLYKYIDNIGGTFNWRKISGTNRLSVHSFGIAIDINVKYSNYWKWEKKIDPNNYLYKNKIPLELIIIFEKHGFIWGGKWYHFDTMHFEYRPELLINDAP